MNHSSCNGLGRRVGGSAAAVAVSNGGGAPLLIGCQDAPGVADADSHQRRCLVQCHVLSEQTVQNLNLVCSF